MNHGTSPDFQDVKTQAGPDLKAKFGCRTGFTSECFDRVLSPKRQTKTLLSQTVKLDDLLFQSYCDLVHLVPGTHRFSQAVPWTSFGKC